MAGSATFTAETSTVMTTNPVSAAATALPGPRARPSPPGAAGAGLSDLALAVHGQDSGPRLSYGQDAGRSYGLCSAYDPP